MLNQVYIVIIRIGDRNTIEASMPLTISSISFKDLVIRVDLVLRYKEHEMKDQYCKMPLSITHRIITHIYRTSDLLMNSTLH